MQSKIRQVDFLRIFETDNLIRFGPVQKKEPRLPNGALRLGEIRQGELAVPLIERLSMVADRPSGSRPPG
jgi:hypothetical protein